MLIETCQRIHDLALAVVGILEFIHQHGAQAGLEPGAHSGILGQQTGSEALEIVEVQSLALILAVLVFGQHLLEELLDGR